MGVRACQNFSDEMELSGLRNGQKITFERKEADSLEQLTGIVQKIIYQNQDNGFTIFLLDPDKLDLFSRCITVKGTFFQLAEGEYMKVCGGYVNDPKYGRQFNAEYYEPVLPDRLDLLEQYLASGIVSGIGPARAKSIIRTFGKDTIRILEEEPQRLTEVSGIGKRTAELIGRKMTERVEERRILIALSGYGIGQALGRKIFRKYGKQTLHVLQSNPYRLIEEVPGVGFTSADKIAMEQGIGKESTFRVETGILYVQKNLCAFGSVYVPKGTLLKEAAATLEVPAETVAKHLEALLHRGDLVEEKSTRIYRKGDQRAERELARRLYALASRKSRKVKREVFGELGGNLDEVQMKAVEQAAKSGLMVLTGGPGTGKTTTTNLMIRYFEKAGKQVVLAAPTGRAAKRMQEATGRHSSTIHRLLGAKMMDNKLVFEKDEKDPLDADVILIDEVSMLDLSLALHLVRAVPKDAQLILVGDKNQLPSVGAGNVLSDLIGSGVCRVMELKKIYRQSSGSDIIANAHQILEGGELNLSNRSHDFFFKPAEDPEEIRKLLLHYVADSLPGFTKEADIQVLAPLRGRALGVNQLNLDLQERLNPGKETVMGFRVGDKVIQTSNNYQIERKNRKGKTQSGVYNGDMGRVKRIDKEEEYLYVEFEDGWTVRYDFSELEQLELAYALTVHKSQGSEYPVVVIPVWDYVPMLTSMNLLYTAVTRAKKYILLIGPKKRLYQMARNVRANDRLTGLTGFLQEEAARKQ